jgi:hypothetical protein
MPFTKAAADISGPFQGFRQHDLFIGDVHQVFRGKYGAVFRVTVPLNRSNVTCEV